MSVSLQKGQKISLAKREDGTLTEVFMGLGWDVARGARDIDLDASCLIFNEGKELLDQVWFKQLKSRDGSVVHSGDNLTGEGEGDDEVIRVQLTKLPETAKSLIFTVNSFRGQDFSTVANARCRLVDARSNRELAVFNLTGGGAHTGLVMAKVYKHKDEWKIHAIGEPGTGRTFKDMMPIIRGVL